MSAPTRFPNGVTNVGLSDVLGQFGQLDPTSWHTFFTDFDVYSTSQWVITTTEAGAGSATEVITDEDGGVLLITNAAGDNDLDFLQSKGELFLLEAGKKTVFKTRIAVSDATQAEFVVGLQIRDTTSLAVTDGIYFRKDDGDTNIDFVVIKDSTATTATAAGTAVDATYIELAFYYNGIDEITYFVDGVSQGKSAVTNLPDDEELTVSFGLQNGEAVAKTLSVDYLLVSKER